MKKVLALVGAFLIISGLKAQNTRVQKETVKPVPNLDTAKKVVGLSKEQNASKYASIKKTGKESAISKEVEIKKATIKEAEIKKATPKEATIKEVKNIRN